MVDIRPLSPAVGAEVTGVRLGDQLSAATIDELFAAFHEHCVLVFPGQHLDPGRQRAFAAQWEFNNPGNPNRPQSATT